MIKKPDKRPNIILICLDGVRADHLGCYGYPVPISPYIDEFAKESVLFKQAFSQSNWTLPSVASVFTSLYPSAHGAHKNPFLRRHIVRRLPSCRKTLAEILKEDGYRTGAFGCIGYLNKAFGLNRGFDVYVGYRINPISKFMGKGKRLKHSIGEFRMWLKFSDGKKPFFTYFHCWDTHEPFIAHSKFFKGIQYKGELRSLRNYFSYMSSPMFIKNNFRNLNRIYTDLINKGHIFLEVDDVNFIEALYNSEISFVDRSFGLFIKKLKKDGLYENSLIVLLADHGNELYEQYRIGHGDSLYNEAVHVPLVIKFPGSGGPRNVAIDEYVELIDIMPTLLEYLSIDIPPSLQGKSLLPLINGASNPKGGKAFFENTGLFRYAVLYNEWKLICYRIGTGVDLNYRLLHDEEANKQVLCLKDVDVDKGVFFSLHNRKAFADKIVTLKISAKSFNSKHEIKISIGDLFEKRFIIDNNWQTYSFPSIQIPKRLHQDRFFIRIVSCEKGAKFALSEIKLEDKEGNTIYGFFFEDLYAYELYNLKQDPEERYNIFFKEHCKAQEMKKLLKAYMQKNIELSKKGEDIDITEDKKLEQQLKQLGYID